MHRAYEAQQSKIKKEEEYIRRFKAGQRARQAMGREKRLDREKRDNLLERPMEMAELKLNLPKAERTGDIVVSARGISKKYLNQEGQEKVLFKDLDISIGRGERWGIIGPNGAGKSTLIRCLLGETPVDQGILRLGSNVKVGHYRQTHEHVPSDVRVYRYLQDVILKEAPQAAMSEQAARNLAGAFLFSGEDQEKEMGMLSGGERSRAVIAGLLASAKNLLILDEPTNHLDISSAERLEDALRVDEDGEGYEGTLILISHDRALIDATCDHLLVLDGKGNTEVFTGGYTDWHEKELDKKKRVARLEAEEKERREAAERQRKAQAEAKAKQPAPSKSGPKSSSGGGPSANSLARLKTDQLEDKIEKIQNRLKAIDGQLGDPDVWRDAKKSSSLSEERTKLVSELEPLEFEWARRAEEN
jgi:ATP-binding cassette subfamily F protein 3